jgi:hypothetical protein
VNRLTSIIEDATAELPTPADFTSTGAPATARDWASFFKALAEFAAAILPLLIPLFVAPKPEETPR